MSEISRTLHVEGLTELKRALKAMDVAAPKEMQQGLKAIAGHVATVAGSKVPRRTGRAGRSYVARTKGAGVGIGIGGPRAPHAPWLDFGGNVRRWGTAGKPITRPRVEGGRYLYPTIEAEMPATEAKLTALLGAVARTHGLDWRG